MLEDAQLMTQAMGTTRLLLRQPLPPDSRVTPNFNLDSDFKTPVISQASIPYRERVFVAKIRSINDYEASQTGVGEVQVGDLMAICDPGYYDDPIQPLQLLDEIRFAEKIFIQGAGLIDRDWDFVIRAINPTFAKNICVGLRLHLRRKKIATAGGSAVPTY